MPLPLKGRVAVRDLWEAEGSEVQKALRNVQETVGWSVKCTPDFAVLWEGLSPVYDDAGEFVTAVTSLIRIWCQELDSLLGDGEHEEWAEKLLSIVGETGANMITLLVEIGKPSVACTSWNAASSTFILGLPNSRVTFAPDHASELRAQLFDAFEKKASVAEPEDWADLGDAKGTDLPVRSADTALAPSAFLPTLSDLPRPDVLQLQPPYRLAVHDRGGYIEVQCSHSPTLELLAGYLQKWCRTVSTRVDRPPIMNVRLNKSAFGLGVLYDALTIAPEDSRDPTLLSPLLILNVVEGALGYKLTQEYSHCWRFVREKQLKAAGK